MLLRLKKLRRAMREIRVSKESEVNPGWFSLVAHKIGSRTYDLSTGLNYVSIKDQIVRACALVDSLKTTGLLQPLHNPNSEHFDLIVVGAGAAGMTAAWRATQAGANTLLVEKGKNIFPLQRGCNDRYVSMSMYDWPEPFANGGAFPSLGDQPTYGTDRDVKNSFPCATNSWKPVTAAKLVAAWEQRLNDCPPEWEIRLNTKAKPILSQQTRFHQDPGFIEIELTSETEKKVVRCSSVILATGVGIERSSQEGYQSYSFWSDDSRAPWAASGNHSNKRILISGSGDGAIQDVLKTLLNLDNGDLIALADSIVPAEIKTLILAAERHAERQLLWGVPESSVCAALQSVYSKIIKQISSDVINEWKSKFLKSDCPEVIWNMSNLSIFSKCYPLNRLLGTLLLREEFENVVNRIPGRIVEVVEDSKNGTWNCTVTHDKAISVTSNFPPLLRHGLMNNPEAPAGDDELRALRAAISRAPVPFKPFDF